MSDTTDNGPAKQNHDPFTAAMEERSRNKPILIGPLQVLRTIIYQMFYLDDLDGFAGIDDRAVLRLKGLYPMERIQRFRMALDWAMVCDDFDFASLLPSLPYDNEQILGYLRIVHETLEDHSRRLGWPDTDWKPDPENTHKPA